MDKKVVIIGSLVLIVGGAIGMTVWSMNKNKKAEDAKDGVVTDPKTGQDVPVNPIKVGDTVYPSGSSVNLRGSAKVDDGVISNKIGVVNSGTIGVVDSIVTGAEDGKTWYKVKLTTPLTNVWYTKDGNWYPAFYDFNYGYVRYDVIKK